MIIWMRGVIMMMMMNESKYRRPTIFNTNNIILLFNLLAFVYANGQPNLQDSVQSPVAVIEGENAPLTCVVRQLGDSTVVWKKWESGKSGPKILTAGDTRVTSDERVRIIHDQGGDVWVLAIRDAKPSDSGLYICEVNTSPVLRSFHNLTVISLNISPPRHSNETYSLPPPSSTDDFPFSEFQESYKGQGSIAGHNYTECCIKSNVSKSCLGFCTLQSILDGSTGEPTQCENEFPRIVQCMADGRDHVPCCVREGVPDICQDLCRGEYTIVTDNVKTHFSCPTFIERTLACIADGVEILPSAPQNLESLALNHSTIRAVWEEPAKNADTVTEYVVNVTTLRSFDAPYTGLGYGQEVLSIQGTSSPNSSVAVIKNTSTTIATGGTFGIDISSEDRVEPHMRQIKVHGDLKSLLITDLEPFTMYEISVTAFNIHGRSLPSVKVRVLTLAPGLSRPNSTTPPQLPDIKTCCIQQGVNSEGCVNKLCDPKLTTSVEIPDLMICAPWTPQVFKCLADGKDHSPCCKQRGIPAPCSDLCTGNITKLDYHYFKCLRYMADYSNCLMDGYGVLPSAPRQVRVSNVNEDFVIIHWTSPSTLTQSVTGYNIHYRPLGTFENLYTTIKNVHPPYILEGLYANSEYEVYVEAINDHGVSEGSQRVVFRTASQKLINAEIESNDAYNETACCVSAGLSSTCMPLCSYEASMSDIRSLAFACATEFHTILRCAAGGRDHSACCNKRGVTESCIDVCSANVPDSLISMAENCLPFIGNIIQCFDEGTELIPGPVEEFHAFLVTDNSVGLSWDLPTKQNITQYQVFYQQQAPSTSTTTGTKTYDLKSVNVTESSTEITGLDKDSIYKFYVVAQNQHGSSVPSAMVQLVVSSQAFDGSKIPGIVSAPHSLVVAGHGATWVQIVWQPPSIAHPSDKITYKVWHRSVKETEYQMNTSSVNSITLDGLKPNAQYILYVTGSNDKGESSPSETLIAWTDPAHSPFVEPPRIQPSNLLVEGGSMTVVCVALGDPTPTISLYINGKIIKQQTNRHLTQVVDNITRDMDIVSCYADNGFGTPMQAARRIQISHLPSISGSEVTYAAAGDSAKIECSVVSFPEPKVAFWKNSQERIPIIDGGNYRVEHEESVLPLLDQPNKYKYTLKIVNVSADSVGNYSCHAENPIGEAIKIFALKTRDLKDASMNISGCCAAEGVTGECMDACSFFMDIESVLDKPACLPHFDKLIKCSADGRDHRACCSNAGVSRRCLDMCRGEPVPQNPDLCVLHSSKQIFNCFREHRDKLPGPPQNVRVEILTEKEARVSWDVPKINPHTAVVYRVFWRPVGQKLSERQDTNTTSTIITNLKPGVNYETVVKAGNNKGTSILTDPIPFITEDNLISSASTAGGSSASFGVGIALLVFLLMGAAVGAVWFLRNRKFGSKPPPGAIAFENPSYIRETNPDIHMNGEGPSNGNGVVSSLNVSNTGNGNGWHSESLHATRTETEVPPTLYEELRLGSEGVGFRRLKP